MTRWAPSSDTGRPRWAFPWRKQFDLVRVTDGTTYLTRWWILATPWFGVCVHRMTNGDARPAVHDHPFGFVSVILRGGYVERRLLPRTMEIQEDHVVRRVNVMRRCDAHSIISLLHNPTWTLLFVGRQYRTWGFWEPTEWPSDWQQTAAAMRGAPQRRWTWTQHQAFDSGVMAAFPPERP